MKKITPFFSQYAFAIIAMSCLFSLSFALFVEHVLGHAPCHLCYWQRAIYLLGLMISSSAIFIKSTPKQQQKLFTLCALIFLAESGVAFYHSGVEQHWWMGSSACVGSSAAQSAEDLLKNIIASPIVRCDEVSWSLLGVSMPNWNAAWALFLSIYTLWVVFYRKRIR
ncbi:MAG: disulfide bond formation protein B [Alphaproteobacteria bacterium]